MSGWETRTETHYLQVTRETFSLPFFQGKKRRERVGNDFGNYFVPFKQFDKDVIDFKIMSVKACIKAQTQ